MSLAEIRPATIADLPFITEIYDHAVRFGTATFELVPPDLAEMTRRFQALVDGGFPYLVAARDGCVVGYAYAGSYRPRPACVRSASTPSCGSPNAPANTPSSFTTSRSETSTPSRSKLTRPGPLWQKKDKRCDPDDPADAEQGSYWDHVIIDPESKLIVSLVVGKRDADTVVQVFTDYFNRTDGALPELITTDGYAVYETVILDTYGVWLDELGLTAEERAELARKQVPEFCFPDKVAYAKVIKEREGGRVVAVNKEVVLGTEEQVEQTLAESSQSQTLTPVLWSGGSARNGSSTHGRKGKPTRSPRNCCFMWP